MKNYYQTGREEALAIYFKTVAALGTKLDKKVEKRTTGELWDLILRDTNGAIVKEFGDSFKTISNLIARRKIKGAIELLYDEGIFVKKAETTALFACRNDNSAIEAEYRKLGGTQKLLVLKDIDIAEEESEEPLGEEPEDDKDIANILDKTDAATYRDYLRLRAQYISYFEGTERSQQEKIYKIVPEKAKKFMYLRDRQITTYWGEQKNVSANNQYNSLVNRYEHTNTHLEPIYDNFNLIGCILELDESGWVQYMHDELQEFCNTYKNELQEKGFANSVTRLKQYEYKGKELSIIAPKEVKDLAIEGSTLHHCVGGFVDAVIRGSENVLFIRRNDNPTKPFFTMALDPAGNIEQVHGFRNSSITKEAQKANFESSRQEVYNKTFDLIAFLKEWAKDKEGLVNILTIKERYGALVAH